MHMPVSFFYLSTFLWCALDPAAFASELMGSGLGSPEILPSVLEHDAAEGANSLPGQADDAFLLQPTPRGVKNYCIIQRARFGILPCNAGARHGTG